MNDGSTLATGDVLPGLVVRRLGMRAYDETRDAMIAFTAARDASTPDELWLVEHPPVYTFGQAGRAEHLLRDVGIPVVRTERGGQITYHGPGQLVGYLLVDLRRRDLKVRAFVARIEEAVIDTLAAYNLDATTKPGAPGVYVDRAGELQKVAALGLKITSRGFSYHGLSLNVDMDLAPYANIDACGFPGLRSIDLATLGVCVPIEAVGTRLAAALAARLPAAVDPPTDRPSH